jgi:hypothetical protein
MAAEKYGPPARHAVPPTVFRLQEKVDPAGQWVPPAGVVSTWVMPLFVKVPQLGEVKPVVLAPNFNVPEVSVAFSTKVDPVLFTHAVLGLRTTLYEPQTGAPANISDEKMFHVTSLKMPAAPVVSVKPPDAVRLV